jgi:hypothetical protein
MSDLWVFGVDPGKMTGLARFDAGAWAGSWQLPMDNFLAYAEGYMFERFREGVSGVIACEDFKITMQTAKKAQGERQWSLEQIGVLRWLARKYGHEFELSSPGNAKTFGNDNKIKAAGWWNPGHGHANDAARQVIIALGRRNIVIGMD